MCKPLWEKYKFYCKVLKIEIYYEITSLNIGENVNFYKIIYEFKLINQNANRVCMCGRGENESGKFLEN